MVVAFFLNIYWTAIPDERSDYMGTMELIYRRSFTDGECIVRVHFNHFMEMCTYSCALRLVSAILLRFSTSVHIELEELCINGRVNFQALCTSLQVRHENSFINVQIEHHNLHVSVQIRLDELRISIQVELEVLSMSCST